jgi:hypothetical protein
MRIGRIGPALIAALTVPWLAGCALLGYPYMDGEDFPEPSIIARYTTGAATLTLGDGTVLALDRVADSSTLDTLSGARVRWTGTDGWHLTLSGAGDSEFGSYAWFQFDRIAEGEHWTIFDESRCIIEVDRADETGVKGTATCKGLQWTDALDMSFVESPKPLDEPKFDADITFEAVAEGNPSSG